MNVGNVLPITYGCGTSEWHGKDVATNALYDFAGERCLQYVLSPEEL